MGRRRFDDVESFEVLGNRYVDRWCIVEMAMDGGDDGCPPVFGHASVPCVQAFVVDLSPVLQ